MPESLRIIRSFRRSLSMHFDPDGALVVRAPRLMPERVIREFIEKHTRWVEKQRARFAQQRQRKPRSFGHGDTIIYQGTEYVIDIGPHRMIEIRETKLLFPKAIAFRIEKELAMWYQKQAAATIRAFVDAMAERMGMRYASIYFSETRSKWGSCSHDNRLQFNWRLIMAPQLVLRYVVIHELAHIREKNHGRAFWQIVATQNPSYKQQIKWLREHGGTIT